MWEERRDVEGIEGHEGEREERENDEREGGKRREKVK